MTTFYSGLADILEVSIDRIGPNFDLTTREWDSLAIVSTLALIDECFDEVVNGQKLAECRYVRDIEALIETVPV